MFSWVPQGSILGLHLFNIYIYDTFFSVDEAFLSYYADKTGLYSLNKKYILNQRICKKIIMNNSWFPPDLPCPFETIMQKVCK